MAQIVFPPSPSLNSVFTSQGKAWKCVADAPYPVWEAHGAASDYFGVSLSSSAINRTNGKVTSIDYDNGVTLTFNYSAGSVSTITSNTGKTKTIVRDVNGKVIGTLLS